MVAGKGPLLASLLTAVESKNALTATGFANTILKAESTGRFWLLSSANRAGADPLNMKLKSAFAPRLGLILISLGWVGCQTHITVVPLRNGYEEVSHPHHALLDEPEPPRISFQRRAADGRVTRIWPSLYGVDDVIKDDLAIFVAEKAALDPERVTHPRLFAVRAPELPLDITDEVLWRWAKANDHDFDKSLQKLALITPQEKNGRLELRMEFWGNDTWAAQRDDWPEQGVLELEWRQLEQIMDAVNAKGTLQQDLRWHTPFIGEKF